MQLTWFVEHCFLTIYLLMLILSCSRQTLAPVEEPALRHYAILASKKSMIREFWRSKEIRGLQFSKIDPRALMTEQYELQGMSK